MKKVWFNEYNVLMANSVYLPLVSGSLQAFAQTDEVINDNFEFMPFNFFINHPQIIADKHEDPTIAAFSTSMWNSNLSLDVAKRVKEKYPETKIIFGGPQVPHKGEEYLVKYDFIDVITRGDGEETFSKLLKRLVETEGETDFNGIAGITYKHNGTIIRNNEEHKPVKDLDIYPSPYTRGVYDSLMEESDIDFQAIIETNRGCPFPCSYCFWGQGGLNMKSRFFSMDRVKEVAEWIGQNKITYVFCADSNFGMYKTRDPEIAKIFADVKEKYGYPEKFRVCYGKNAQESIFKTATILHGAGLEKGITLARQSNDPTTLKNARRNNIKMEVYDELQHKYNELNIPTYTELIIGLPGETYESFANGLEEILQSSVNNQTFIYHAQVFPNTLLANAQYQEKHGVQVQRIKLTEVHGAIRASDFIDEDEDIVISTNTMPIEDWKKTTTLAWIAQSFHGLKQGFHLTNYLHRQYGIPYTNFFKYILEESIELETPLINEQVKKFNDKAEAMLNGEQRCVVIPEFGNVYWDNEVASYLNLSHDKKGLNEELLKITQEYLISKNIEFNDQQLREVVKYQEARTEDYKPINQIEFSFEYNVPEYFEYCLTKSEIPLIKKPQTMILDNPKDYNGDKEKFAREAVMWSRRSNRMQRPVKWIDKEMTSSTQFSV